MSLGTKAFLSYWYPTVFGAYGSVAKGSFYSNMSQNPKEVLVTQTD